MIHSKCNIVAFKLLLFTYLRLFSFALIKGKSLLFIILILVIFRPISLQISLFPGLDESVPVDIGSLERGKHKIVQDSIRYLNILVETERNPHSASRIHRSPSWK